MAEVVGVVAGSLSIAVLFNNCVDCFNHVQLEAMGINKDLRFSRLPTTDDATELLIKNTLGAILNLFEDVEKTSKQFLVRTPGPIPLVDDTSDTTMQALHIKMRGMAQRRQKSLGLFRKASWALYQKENDERLEKDISKLLACLESCCSRSNEDSLQRLAVEEVTELGVQELRLVGQEAQATDPLLKPVVEAKLEGRSGIVIRGHVKATGKAKVMFGDEWSDAALSSGFQPSQAQGNYSIGDIDASDNSKLLFGSRYGGRSIFDN